MTVISVDTDFESLSLTLVADFAAPVEQVWQLWADPRRLERWWGPPSWPATFVEHDLTPGGRSVFFMTGPEGEKSRGYWRITSVEPPTALEYTDGWADEDGNPVEDMPVTQVQVQLSERADGSRMVVRSVFESDEHMKQIVDVGAVEAFQQTVGQMDALLDG